ncbi:hypothetical protein N1851_006532 [Merluccius polli]|uniref:Uncharacterized protein n=1 Tax=Merluccius polli TaxID=89951 RepID=A0AA47P613_MERPO|nr:hypothetical protein N1851_006532 [Merluccius polli]
MIQNIFNHSDILDKIKETKVAQNSHYVSHQDGLYFKENTFFQSTSRKIHKICLVYWRLADLPSKYQSALHMIQLAALCKVADIQTFGYEKALVPLLRDLRTLEQDDRVSAHP